MSELTDDQLDGLFRKSAEEFDPPFDPAAWQDMKSRLDTIDRPAPGGIPLWKNILRWGLPIGLLVLLMVGGVYTYRQVVKGRDATAVVSAKIPPAATNAQSTKPLLKGQKRPTASELAPIGSARTALTDVSAQPIEKGDQSAALEMPGNKSVPDKLGADTDVSRRARLRRAVNEPKATESPAAANNVNEAYKTNANGAGSEPETNSSNRTVRSDRTMPTIAMAGKAKQRTGRVLSGRFASRKPGKANRMNSTGALFGLNDVTPARSSFSKKSFSKTPEGNLPAAINLPEAMAETAFGKAETSPQLNVNELAIRPARWPKALPFTGRHVAAQPDTTLQRVRPTPAVDRGLSIRFAVAPDLSSVGLRNFARPGTNVGVLLEYRIASRWSVQAGIIQSTKVYEASVSDYTIPAGSYVETVRSKIGRIDGQCSMFDIPINLRYDFALRPRASGLPPSRWFINSGVTSYYIKQEDYVYNYTGYVHNAVSEWSTKTGGYGFSQLNLSVGYERALTKRLSWQVEPFMKMPLKGVGYFKIDLMSTGAFFSIRYKL